ncbi:MAG: RyR domain-containing protein, partial [Roseimicrobium sp.]
MSAPEYQPRPIDASAVKLTPDLAVLTEKLAENAHDLWAQERLAQGWTWGPARDDVAKKHPGLVPYAALADSEKQFDRETAMGTLKALLTLGTTMETLPPPLSAAEEQHAAAWEAWLKAEAGAIEKDRKNPRGWDFDMNDQPELDSGKLADFPTLHRALSAFQEHLEPVWRRLDREANTIQQRHQRVAHWAIIPGVLAILLAIVQLALPEHHELAKAFSIVEFTAAIVAAVAVLCGYLAKTRNRWLTARQAAERLRVVKFRALADPLLWCDFEAWKQRWLAEVAKLATLKFKQAEDWVHSGNAEPTIPGPSPCPVPTTEVRAIASYYLAKRQGYQCHYFRTKAADHKRDTWMLRLRLPVCLFFMSVLFVIAHAGIEVLHPADANSTVLVTILLTLAAALPVIGFGVRARFSAFELPRRAQLFEGKATQLTAT